MSVHCRPLQGYGRNTASKIKCFYCAPIFEQLDMKLFFLWISWRKRVPGNDIADSLEKFATSSISPHPDEIGHGKTVHSPVKPPICIFSSQTIAWINGMINMWMIPRTPHAKKLFPQIRRDCQTQKHELRLKLSTQDQTLQVKQFIFHACSPSQWIMRSLPRPGNGYSFSHCLPNLPFTALETPTRNE